MGKTATGQIISTYVRPSFTEIEKEVLDKQIEQGFGKQLSLNMWQVGTYPNRRRTSSTRKIGPYNFSNGRLSK